MASNAYIKNFLNKAKANLPDWMFTQIHHSARGTTGGQAKRKPMNIQTLIFDKSKFSSQQAKDWARDNNFKGSDVDETDNSFRLRQKTPGDFKTFRTIDITGGVKAVVAKADPQGSSVHVPVPMGSEDEDYNMPPDINNQGPKVLKKHDKENLSNLKANLTMLVGELDKFFDEETVEKDEEDLSLPVSAQLMIEAIDYEMEHGITDFDTAQEVASHCLDLDPLYYRKLQAAENSTDDQLEKDTSETEEDPFEGEGLNLDLGSGTEREPGHIGIDTYPYDHGTYVHDLSMGIPFDDQVAKSVRLTNALHEMDNVDKNDLMQEVARVLIPGGNFIYEGPEELTDLPDSLVQINHENNEDEVDKENTPSFRQQFVNIVQPDPATSDDADPRIGVNQYDKSPSSDPDAIDQTDYYYSDATSSGRGNRAMGYPSQGAAVNKGGPGSGRQGSGEHAEHAVQRLVDGQHQIEQAKRELQQAKTPAERDKARNKISSAMSDRQAARDSAKYHGVHQAMKDIEKSIKKVSKIFDEPELKTKNAAVRKQKIEKLLKKNDLMPIYKADQEKRIVYGVVLAPNEVDAQEDWMEPEDIEQTAHEYLMKSRVVGSRHMKPIKSIPVESYIAPQDLEFDEDTAYGPQVVKKGSWVLGVKVLDDSEWDKVKSGEYTGYSIGGFGLRE